MTNTTTTFESHVSVLKSAAALFPSCNAFKVAIYDDESDDITGWEDITYEQFYDDVERMAAHWIETLALAHNSVVGVWLTGLSYDDVVTLFSITRAGYVPQIIRLTVESPAIVPELLTPTNAKAFIHHPSHDVSAAHFLIPVHRALDVKSLRGANMALLPPLDTTGNPDDPVLYYYTSGSMSGRPKLVPYRRKFLDAVVKKSIIPTPMTGLIRPVINRIGSSNHACQLQQFICRFPSGACHVLVRPDFSSNHLIQMVEQCGLTILNIFSYHLIKHLKNARTNARLLTMLQSMDEIICDAGLLPENELDWAFSNGLHVTTRFGLTETTILLTTPNKRGEKAIGFTTLDADGLRHEFVPLDKSVSSGREKLVELVIFSDSSDCPDASFCSEDGHFHTGDTFVEVAPNLYASRGRMDERIKMYRGSLCDARAIAEHVNQQCRDLITDCIVVGAARPSPTLIVEVNSRNFDEAKIAAEISVRIAEYNEGLYLHERIKSNHILVVESGTLPRTGKGSIQRNVVEQRFKSKLNEIDALAA